MRWSTLVLSVTLFCSLSFVNAIPHDVDEKRHWLHKRQGTSSTSDPVIPPPSVTPNPSNSVVSSTSAPDPRPTSRPGVSTSSSTQRPSGSTSQSSGDLSSTVSSSSSSSSSSLSSSSISRSSSSTSSTITSRPNPGNTSYRQFSSTRSLPSDTKSAGGNVQTGTASGNSFLKNKGAMGATFALIGLVGAGVIAGTIFYLKKKTRQRKHRDDLDTYFEKLPAGGRNRDISSNQNLGGGNEYGLGPSAADLTAPASAQAFMPRDVHYGATNQYPSMYPDPYPNYNGLEYPPERGSVIERPASFVPGTAYAAAMSQQGQYNYSGQVEDPNTVPNHPFADPEHRHY